MTAGYLSIHRNAGERDHLAPFFGLVGNELAELGRRHRFRDAADKRLSAGDVVVEVAQEAVSNAADIKKRVEQLKKDGKKSVLLLVSNADGELRFVALSVQ